MQSIEKIFNIIVAIVIIFFAPMYYVALKQDQINQTYVYNATVNMVDNVRNNGYLTEEVYDRYIKILSNTGNSYEIEIEHIYEKINPVYDLATYLPTGEYVVNEEIMYTKDILDEVFRTGIHKFTQGDYISVRVYNKNETLGGRLQRVFARTEKQGGQIELSYGGMIRDENY